VLSVGRVGLGGVDVDLLAGVDGKRERFIGEGQVTDNGVVQPFGASVVQLHIVPGPQDAEPFTAGG
jgi:hypothetical protein